MAAGFSPHGVAVSPDGRSAYVTDYRNVWQYDVGPSGALSPKSPATVASGDMAYGVAASPDGESVYVTDYTLADVWQYDVGPAGRFRPRAPPRFRTTATARGGLR